MKELCDVKGEQRPGGIDCSRLADQRQRTLGRRTLSDLWMARQGRQMMLSANDEVGWIRVCCDPDQENVTFFHSKRLLNNSASFTLSRMEDVCQKQKVKLIFRGAYWLPWTGIVECLETIDVGSNVKQFDGLTWLTLTPIFTTDLRHCALVTISEQQHSKRSHHSLAAKTWASSLTSISLSLSLSLSLCLIKLPHFQNLAIIVSVIYDAYTFGLVCCCLFNGTFSVP